METIIIPKREIEWLLKCSDSQMGDGDTARELAQAWLNGQSGVEVINREQRRMGMAELSSPQASSE